MHHSSLKRLLLPIAITISFISICLPSFAANQATQPNSVQQKLAALETASGGRLGIYALNTANNTHIAYRTNERFPFCSTSKVMVVSAILKQSMTNDHLLQEKISYKKNDIKSYSPVTKKHIGNGMTISELAAAAISYSDNSAVNFLIKKLGGVQVVTAFARSIGDNEFRLDRLEPELNTAIPGDPRDTTTPAAMAASLQKLALGDSLGPTQRAQLQTWLKDNTTGDAKIRAGVPKDWVVGDKTGSGNYGTSNDIGVIWPPHCAPIVVAIYFTHNHKDAKPDDKIIADATRILISEFAHSEQCLKTKS